MKMKKIDSFKKKFILKILFFICVFGFMNNIICASDYDDDYNLVGFWNFNEGKGNVIYDNSINKNNGLIFGCCLFE